MQKRFSLFTHFSLLAFAAVFFAAVPHAHAQGETAKPEEAKQATVRLKDLDGKTHDTAEMRGEVVVVSFGATWCVPCAWELKAIEELKEEYAGKPVRFLWVSIEEKERTSDRLLRHYAKSQRLTIPVLRDGDMSAFSQFSETTRIPLVVFFDREGRFDAPVQRGMSNDITTYKQRVRARVNPLLDKKPDAPAPEDGGKTSK